MQKRGKDHILPEIIKESADLQTENILDHILPNQGASRVSRLSDNNGTGSHTS